LSLSQGFYPRTFCLIFKYLYLYEKAV
jgi:hypothetical protein